MNHIQSMSQTELRTYLRQLKQDGAITFYGDSEKYFAKFVNGQLGGGIEALRRCAEELIFPVEGIDIDAERKREEREPIPDIPEPARTTTPTAKVDREASRQELLRELLSGVDRDEVIQIVNDVFDKRIGDGLPERRIIVTPAKVKKLDGTLYHKVFDDVLMAIGAGLHAALVGPAGTGKTEMAECVAKALELPFHFTGKVTSEFQLLGFRDAHGTVHETEFRRAFVNGGLFLFDEMDASSPNAVTRFNAALSNGYCDFPDGHHKAHPNFKVIAASNTFWSGATREYVGRNPMDGASKDRFCFIEVDYDNGLERLIASQYDSGEAIAVRVQSVRKAITDLKIRHIASMRATISLCKLIGAGMHIKKAERIVLWKDLSDDQVRKIEKHIKDQRKGGDNE